MSTTTSATVVIRPAHPGEFAQVGELTAAAYVQGGHLQREDSYVQELTRVAERAQSSTVLVAHAEGQLVGTVTVTEAEGPFAEVSRPGELEFRMLAVAPEAQGRGVARALVRHIVAEAAARPEIRAVCLCSLKSMTAAHALYESEGFIREPRRDFVLDIPEKRATFPFFIRSV
ncbi:GNAT family N-acetyltransferase [Nesterenkonia sphaerica]|uniref:GNAT family N-acetyltransferase n=1 Tax=Nesterenkonia sphaerica TaxID=1804988 RepID=A0A5R9AJ81_9MICC|nr:GNAT family N-acetyltransferase [Nesterenkonia sphaerica]TLP78849.1 GNAT family N-acetyltransferase [Nesterenkonia sphaerica]